MALDARHAAAGALVATGRSEPHPDDAYRLTFMPTDARSVVQATVVLHGLAGQTVLPAATAGEGTATEQLTLAPSAQEAHRFVSLLHPARLTGVQWIDVQSLRFANGTTWKSSAASRCRVAPNGFRLVAQAR